MVVSLLCQAGLGDSASVLKKLDDIVHRRWRFVRRTIALHLVDPSLRALGIRRHLLGCTIGSLVAIAAVIAAVVYVVHTTPFSAPARASIVAPSFFIRAVAGNTIGLAVALVRFRLTVRRLRRRVS